MTRTVFTRANLLDGRGPARPDSTVIIDGEHVTEVDAGGSPVDGDRVIDLGGRTLMPGMATCHGHIDMGKVKGPPGVMMAQAMQNCRAMLESGVTGFVGAGCGNDIDAQLQMAIAEGLMDGPRILAGSRLLSTTGHDNDMSPWWHDRPNAGGLLVVDGADGFRRAAREEIRRGAEIVKIFLTSGHGTEGAGRGLSREELVAVVGAAHERGRKVRAHAIWRDDILEAVEAGVDVIDHGDETDEEIVGLMAERGTFWVPSMAFLKWLTELERGEGREWGVVLPSENAGRNWDNLCRVLPMANEAGVRVVTGDDYGTSPLAHRPGVYARELTIYANEVGVKAIDVLGWATRNAGELLGKPVGVVEPGALADLVVVDGDPSDDIALLEDPGATVKAVLVGGRFVVDRLTG